jgi:uncharacterized membrane protein
MARSSRIRDRFVRWSNREAQQLMLYNISILDWAALALFVALWFSYTWFADFSPRSVESLPKVMDFHHRRWMREMLKRDLRMPDALVMSHFVQSSVFFASTAILVIGGLVATLGASEKALEAIAALPFVSTPTKGLWALKVVSLICVFIYAFVKFIWAVRLANYSSVLFNAAPIDTGDQSDDYAVELGKITGLCAKHFNQGLRANFFALAILGWWINAYIFIFSTCIVLRVLYRREFRSKSLLVAHNLKQLASKSGDSEPD